MWPSQVSLNHDSLNTTLPKPKRRKIDVACDTCRLRKSRCDGARPKCSACTRRKNVGPVCIYSEQPPATASAANPPSLVLPRTQLPANQQPERTPLSDFTDSPSQNPASQKRIDADPAPDDSVSDNANWILKAGLLAASSSARFFSTVFGASETEEPVDNDERQTNQRIRSKEPPPVDPNHGSDARQRSIHAMEYVLPSRKVADSLLDRFFAHAYIRWLDSQKFVRWYEGLWTGTNGADDVVGEQISYANLNIIFALVYQTEPEELAEDQDQLAQAYFARAQKFLQLSLLDLNRLDLLWTLLLLTQWFQSVNNVRRCTSMVGICILIGRNLGLHIAQRTNAMPNQHQREMARRAWHGCILMDRITAMISGQPLQISQEVARQAPLFEAIDDEFLSTEEADGIQPPGKPPRTSFFLAFCQLHLILGDVLAHFQSYRQDGRPIFDVNHIIDIDNKLNAFAKTLPDHLRIDKVAQQDFTYTGPIVHLHSRFLHIRVLLYRVFFLHAVEVLREADQTSSTRFSHAITHQGLLTCVRAAQEMLELIGSRLIQDDRGPREFPPNPVALQPEFPKVDRPNEVPKADNQAGLVPQWWHTVTYVYTATTILIAAHLFPEVVEQVTPGELASSIQQGFQILEYHSRNKESARRCKTALTVLCERHVKPVTNTPKHTPNGTVIPVAPPDQGSGQFDAAGISADFGWDFSDPFDIFQAEGIDSFLFSTSTPGPTMSDWL